MERVLVESSDTISSTRGGACEQQRCTGRLEFVTIHGHRRAFVEDRLRARPAAAARPRLRPHHLGAGHRVAGPPLHRDRARPARPRRVGQAARRLQRRRLRQRHARPAHRARHRPGHRRRAQLRRRRGDAVRLPVPRAHRAADPGRLRRPRPRGHAGDPGDHHARLPPGDGPADAARHPARRRGRPARPGRHRHPGHPRPRRGRRHLRLVQGPAHPGRDPPRRPRRRRLARARSSR